MSHRLSHPGRRGSNCTRDHHWFHNMVRKWMFLKDDLMSGLAGDFIASASVPEKPHLYETRTSIQGAHYWHAILICWSDLSRCCWVKAICVLQTPFKQCEKCLLEFRQPVSDPKVIRPRASFKARMLSHWSWYVQLGVRLTILDSKLIAISKSNQILFI